MLPENSLYFPAHLLSPSSRRAWVEINAMALALCRLAVALLAEGVGRNSWCYTIAVAFATSPSSRRAWVEIRYPLPDGRLFGVALLAEGVGRNPPYRLADGPEMSPSSRRAWVEIHYRRHPELWRRVALLAEGVGRNQAKYIEHGLNAGRPPRGGRG